MNDVALAALGAFGVSAKGIRSTWEMGNRRSIPLAGAHLTKFLGSSMFGQMTHSGRAAHTKPIGSVTISASAVSAEIVCRIKRSVVSAK